MKFIIDRLTFTESVSWIARYLPARPTIPVLAGILIKAEQDGITFSVFDYEVSASDKVIANVELPGEVLISGKLLAEITKVLPDADVCLEEKGSVINITCANSEFDLPIMHAEDYPPLPAFPELSGNIESELFIQSINQVSSSASKDDTLPMLTGIKLTITGSELTLAATDRFRLAVKKLQWQPKEHFSKGELLIPAKRLAELTKVIPSQESEVSLSFPSASEEGAPHGESIFGFSVAKRQSTSRILDHQYPPYEKLIPDSHETLVNVSSQLLSEAIKRVSLVAFRSSLVKFEFTDNSIIISAGGEDSGKAKEEIPAQVLGKSLTIAFNPSYIIDGLHAVSHETVTLALNSANKAVVLFAGPQEPDTSAENPEAYVVPPQDFIYLVMPTRLPN